MLNKTATIILSATLLAIGSSGCSTTTVSRVDSEEELALTDKWNATDSRLVAEEMTKDMMLFPWFSEHQQKYDTKPTIIVQSIRNKSHEHISADTFVNDLKRAMLRTGEVDFVVSGSERQALRDERADQELNASLETQAAQGQEYGASYALSGTINSFVDELDGKRVTAYQVDLKLIDMSSNKEVWNGQKKLQKLQEKSRFGL